MKILLIEDEAADAALFKLKLDACELHDSHDLVVRKSLVEGMAEVKHQSFDLIICDLGLPDAKGPTDVLSALDIVASDIPIIVLTSDSREIMSVKSLQSGAEDFLNKNDITPQGLLRSISNSIERKKLKNNLSKSMRESKAATNAKSVFLANMSHEIRTPLNLIIGSADLLKETKLDGKQQKFVDTFQKAGEHLLSLINDILDISKIESGELKLNYRDYDLEATLNSIAELVALSCRSKKLNFEYYFDPKLQVTTYGEPDRLKQILFNLLNNSIKFTSEGLVGLEVIKAENGVLFSVTDSGPGIPEEKCENIFKSFYQLSDEKGFSPDGTGLGLAIVRELTNKMSGSIHVDSTYKNGAKFDLFLPLPIEQKVQSPSSNENLPIKDREFFIMASNSAERATLKDTIEAYGGIVTVAESGREAQNLIQKDGPWDFYLLDLQMDDMGAFKVLAGSESKVPTSKITFLLPSIHRESDLEIIETFKDSNYIHKPLSPLKITSIFWSDKCSNQRNEEEGAGAPLRVLVVEDDIDNRELVKAYLEPTPHVVNYVENGQEAINMYLKKQYDVVLMDVQMPVMDGHKATSEIRRIEAEKNVSIPIEIHGLSANAFTEDVEKAKACGFSGYLTKPIRKNTLLNLLSKIKPVSRPQSKAS
tara:strand:+ start:5327 stop:7273 length:1947 start_codon:yes stop_codon:yes gene_type:complete